MAGGKSRWANDEDDAALEAQRKQEKEEKKRAKLEKQRKLEEVETRRKQGAADSAQGVQNGTDRPAKRRRLSNGRDDGEVPELPRRLMRFATNEWGPCRHVDNFERLNHIEEGSYGWVSRARETATGEVVALKKLKMDNLTDGFPVTALREIQTLKESRHRHVVDLREVVVGDTLDECVLFIFQQFNTAKLTEQVYFSSWSFLSMISRPYKKTWQSPFCRLRSRHCFCSSHLPLSSYTTIGFSMCVSPPHSLNQLTSRQRDLKTSNVGHRGYPLPS
jgi:serine/threonine protein kinase